MKYLRSRCRVCRSEFETGYKNAYCIPSKGVAVVCAACALPPEGHPGRRLRKAAYYKPCERDGCGLPVYEVGLDLDAAGKVIRKDVKKRACRRLGRP